MVTAHGDCSADGDAGGPLFQGPVTGRFLTDRPQRDGSRVRNYTGDLGALLLANLDTGSSGCSFVRPLEAMRRALVDPANAGFVRTHAGLAVVFLTASDDCSFQRSSFVTGAADTFECIADPSSLVPVTEYASFLNALKANASNVVVIGALGPATPFVVDPATRTVEPSCTIEQRSAAPATRLHDFLGLFPYRSLFTSICQPDFTPARDLIANLHKMTLQANCVEPLLDVDVSTPGNQYSCAAWVRETIASRISETVLPACAPDEPVGTSCWELVLKPDLSNLCTPDGQILRLPNTFASTDADNNSFAVLECVVE